MKILYLAWQDRVGRGWHPIGRLTFEEGYFEFVYIEAARKAAREHGFTALSAFPDIDRVYRSGALFPIFANRLLKPNRPDYSQFLEWLGLSLEEADSMAILARSGGVRETDGLEVFPCPEQNAKGEFRVQFFVHGVRHLPQSSHDRIDALDVGEQLFLMHDFQNPVDGKAMALRTGKEDRDAHVVGYCPRYFAEDFHKVCESAEAYASVRVVKVNKTPAPIQLKLLCEISGVWPAGFSPMSGDRWKPVVATGRESEEAA